MIRSIHTENFSLGRRDFLKTGVLIYARAIVPAGTPLSFAGHVPVEKRLEKLHEYLVEHYGEETASALYERIKSHYEDLSARKPHFSKWGMNFNVTNAIIALSVYRTLLEDGVKKKEAIETAGTLVWATLPVDLYKKVFRFIEKTPDPFSSYVFMTKQLNRMMFPSPGWERYYVVEEDDRFGFDVTKCLYVDYLTSEGAPELVVALCDLDYRVAELFPDGIHFHRNISIARGDKICDFRYYRK